jgi:hypothetical protein
MNCPRTSRRNGLFFWQFDAKCKQNNVEVHWFFPRSGAWRIWEFDNFDSNNRGVFF